jgi:cytochrome oxidase assembly protein ShyY1
MRWRSLPIIGEIRSAWVKTRIALLLLVLLVEALLLRLGFWQLARGHEKQEQLVQVAGVLNNRQGIALADMDRASQRIEWAGGAVWFMPGPVFLLDNQRRGSEVGVIVYQPALLPGGPAILVELGWLPVTGNRQMPPTPAYHRDYRLEGLLLPPPSPGIALGQAAVKQADGRWLMTRVDMPALESIIGGELAARVLRPDPALDIGFARDLDVQANTLPPEKHRAYALQWFGLAAAWLILWFYVARRKKHER